MNLKQRLLNYEDVFGIWSVMPDPDIAELISNAAFDFCIADFEHGTHTIGNLTNYIRAAGSCEVLIRPAGLNVGLMQTALDAGATGIIMPQIETRVHAEKTVSFCNFAPKGRRGYNPFCRKGTFNDAITAVIIENIEAVENFDSIIKTDYLDIVYLGVYDLSKSAGFENINEPVIKEFVKQSIRKIRNAGKVAGVMVHNKEEIEYYKQLGVTCFVYLVDRYWIKCAFPQILKGY
jgi:4-hydroxy-2-oxoheptanedioate aldolase